MKCKVHLSRAPWWGRWDLTVSVFRAWHGGNPALQPHWQHLGAYVSLFPVIRLPRPVHGRRWAAGWLFGCRGEQSGPQHLHLGPIGFHWT